MSLKAIHLVFITASTVLAFGFCVWGFSEYDNSKSPVDLSYGIGSLVAGVGLIVYGRYFLKKLKHTSYL